MSLNDPDNFARTILPGQIHDVQIERALHLNLRISKQGCVVPGKGNFMMFAYLAMFAFAAAYA
jgi:hypothetical protein